MFDDLTQQLTHANVRDYIIQIDVTDDWVCFKDSAYPSNSTSRKENRFNRAGQDCYYAASGVLCAKAEVPNFVDRELYRISPQTINAFDLPRFSRDHKCEAEFLKSKDEGGWKICQAVAEHLHTEIAVTGIIYNSHKMAINSEPAFCLALLPNSGHLVDDTYFIKV